MLKKGRVSVNGKVTKTADTKCADSDIVTVYGEQIAYSKFVYIMMNKPQGVISASDGKGEKTVVDLLPDDMKRRGLRSLDFVTVKAYRQNLCCLP